MKKLVTTVLILLTLSSLIFAEAVQESNEKLERTLTVYCYDSFASDWGPGPSVIPAFEEKTGIKVNLVSQGNAVEMLNKLIMEGENTAADVVLGLTDDIADKAYQYLESYEAPSLKDIPDELKFDSSNRLIPFDYGTFAFVYDSEANITKPESLEDLIKPEYKGKVILIDPRTSSVGMGLLLWTYNIYGDDYISWWKKMSENALTIASGWSSAYGLFTEGEAPIVLSYTTSPIYHVLNDNTTRYQALVFDQGHEATIECVGITKTSKHKSEAKEFIDYILNEAQLEIAIANSMYPVNSTTKLIEAFDYAPKPAKMYRSGQISQDKLDKLLQEWTEAVTR